MSTSSPVIPKFNFNNNSIKSDKDLDEKLAESGSLDKYLRAGKHEVTITGVEYVGTAKDSRWGQFKITYMGTGEKTTQEWLLVPFQDAHYTGTSGKETLFPFKRVQGFVKALGGKLTNSSLESTMNTYFAKPEKGLVGLNLAITVGYEGNHVDFKSKDQYVITMKDGSTLADQDGKSLVFTTRDAAVEHCEQQSVSIDKYTRVLSYDMSSTGPKKVVGGNW